MVDELRRWFMRGSGFESRWGRARHRLSKFLLRRHCLNRQTKHHWGTRHVAWLEQLRFDDPMSQATFDSYWLTVQQRAEQLQQLDARLAEFGAREPYREPVACCGASRESTP